ncbi:MAG: SHOCT domain-containing protein [Chloroflexi bacterium]|nr:SHOCT domain-containing protein [Chloroflexota bacterium]
MGLILLALLVGPLGPLELVILLFFVAFVWALPGLILYLVAKNRGRSWAWALWALLGWLGFVVGLVVLLVAPNLREAPESSQAPRSSEAADNLLTLAELRDRGLLTDAEFEERRARELERL